MLSTPGRVATPPRVRANTTETSEVLIWSQRQGKIPYEPLQFGTQKVCSNYVALKLGRTPPVCLTKVHAAIRRIATCISIIIFALSTSGWAIAT